MLIVICIAGAAALAVVAYQQLEDRSPESASAGLKAVRELAAVVLVLVKAVEGVVDVLAHQKVQAAPANTGWRYRNYDEFDDEDEQR
jgi:hypothetical protein